MSPPTRTFSLVFIVLSFIEGLLSSQIVPEQASITSDSYSNLKGPSLLRGNKPSCASDLLSAAQRLQAASQRPRINEVITQPLITESPSVSVCPSCSQASVEVNPSPILPLAEVPCNAAAPVISQPQILGVESAPECTFSPSNSFQVEYSGDINKNYLSFGQVTLDTIPPQASLPEAYHTDMFVQYPDLSQLYSPPISVQIPSMPVIAPFLAVATPVPAMLPQNLAAQNTGCEQFPEIANSPVVIPSDIGSVLEPSYNQQLPFSFQINMPPQQSEQHIILISSASPSSQDYSTSNFPSMMPPPPMVVSGRSRSSWKSWLPLLLVAMCDGGCGNGCGNCCGSGGNNIPVPYPIPIPTNNPIIVGGSGKAKGNSTTTTSGKASDNSTPTSTSGTSNTKKVC